MTKNRSPFMSGLLIAGASCLVHASVAAAQDAGGGAQAAADALVETEDQQQTLGRERVDIEPYAGPPVFLPEEEAPPPPVEVSSQVVREKYPTLDTPRFERRMVRMSDDSLVSDGPHKEFYASGELFVQGVYDNSRATGEWTYFHPNGTLAKKVNYIDGRPDGEVEVYDDEGNLTEKRAYNEGARNGTWTQFVHDDGEQRQTRALDYKDGKPHGEWKVWYRNGNLRQVQTFVEGVREGPVTEWSRSGEKRAEASFVDGKREGETVIYNRDGSVKRMTYKAGKLVEQSESGSAGG